MPPLHPILKLNGDLVALIKPQFEAGREKVGKHGIIHDPNVHKEVINMIIDFAVSHQYDVCGLDFSPITGGHGNIEFLIHLKAVDRLEKVNNQVNSDKVVKQAHSTLKNQ